MPLTPVKATTRLIYVSLGAVLALSSLPAVAQVIPDAGVLERQLRQEGLQRPSAPPPAAVDEQKADHSGERVFVRRFVLNGVTLMPLAELETLLAPYTQRELTLGEMQEAAALIASHYRDRGYFARTYLPVQDVTDGIVHIEVVEGRLGEVTVEGDATRADKDYLRKVVIGQTGHGEHYSANRLERGLLLANDLPGVQADGVLKAGSGVGLSDFVLRVTDTPFITRDFSLNNFGSRATDEIQAGFGMGFNNLGGRGDQLTMRVLGSKNLIYGHTGYSLPIGADGLRAGVSASYLEYELGSRFAALDAEGAAYTLAANASYPFIRSDEKSLWGALSLEHRNYDDDMLGTAIQRKEVNAFTASVNGDWSDGLLGGSLNRYYLALVYGDLDLSGEPGSFAADQAGPRAHGRYAKISGQLQRDQAVAGQWFTRSRVNGQLAMHNLDSSEKFSLGGPYGVRAYPVNEALGDHGAVVNIELHKLLREWDIYAFFDAGVIRQYHDTWAGWNAGTGAENTYWLAGAGIGANYPLAPNVQLSGTLAVPVGAHKGEPANDRNQDGTKQDPRLWIGITGYF